MRPSPRRATVATTIADESRSFRTAATKPGERHSILPISSRR